MSPQAAKLRANLAGWPTVGWSGIPPSAPSFDPDKPHVAPKTRRTEEVHQLRAKILIGPPRPRKKLGKMRRFRFFLAGDGKLGLRMRNEFGAERRSSAVLRAALMSGFATALIAGLSEPAAAYWLFGDPWASTPRFTQGAPSYKRKRAYPRYWQQQQTTDPAKAKPQVVHEKPQDPLTLVISIKSQKVSLYGNGKLIETSIISTGTPGHDTPLGVFSVIEKDRHHRSNIYSNAPMPYMQRITWSGVALHEGFVTGRPASHGCIRLPQAFAARLWEITQLGVRVVVAPDDVAPVSIAHDRLFAMKPKPALPPVATLQPDPVPTAKIRLATNAERTDTATVAETAAAPPAKL